MGDAEPLGAIFDTNSGSRFDLVVYRDGILAVKGTYLGVAMRAGGAGFAVTGSPLGSGAGERHERARLANTLTQPRSEVLAANPKNHFIRAEDITNLVLKKRWYGHSLTIMSLGHVPGRKYGWKPALNSFDDVRALLSSAFEGRLLVE